MRLDHERLAPLLGASRVAPASGISLSVESPAIRADRLAVPASPCCFTERFGETSAKARELTDSARRQRSSGS